MNNFENKTRGTRAGVKDSSTTFERMVWLRLNKKKWEGIPSSRHFPPGPEAMKRDWDRWQKLVKEMRAAGLYSRGTQLYNLCGSVQKLAYQVRVIIQCLDPENRGE